jgi:hypothetical protein
MKNLHRQSHDCKRTSQNLAQPRTHGRLWLLEKHHVDRRVANSLAVIAGIRLVTDLSIKGGAV